MFIRNYALLTAAEVVSKIVTFAAFAYVARITGPAGFGHLEFAGAVLLCAGLIVDQGLGSYGAREIAKQPECTAALVGQIIFARLLLAAAAYLSIVTLALSLDHPPIVRQLLLIYGISLFAMPFLLQWVFQGHDRMGTVAAAQLIRQGTFAMLVFAAVRQATQLWWVAAAEICGVALAAGYTVWMYHHRLRKRLTMQLRPSRQLFREAAPIGVSQMLWVLRMYSGTLILGFIAPAPDVGLFAAALRVLVAVHSFVWLYYFNLLPSLSRAWQAGVSAFDEVIRRSMRLVVWGAVAAGTLWVAIAPAAATAMYGPLFRPAASTLQWLAGVCVLAAISGHYRFGLIAAGRQTAEMATSALGAATALGLIPLGYIEGGPRGAAMGMCVAETVVWVSSWVLARRLLGLGRPVVALRAA